MKKLIPYLFFSLLLCQTALGNNGSGILGNEPTVVPEWDAKVYPNPNNGVFNVMVTGSSAPLKLLVFNVIGEKVYQLEILGDHGVKVDLSSLDQGLYVVQVVDENRSEVRTMRMQVK